MPRRKPTSTTRKKQRQKLSRAVKRGDVTPPDPSTTYMRMRRKRPPIKPSDDAAAATHPERLESTFVKVPPKFLEESKYLASTIPLSRPLSNDVANLKLNIPSTLPTLTCPRRPKWSYDSPADVVLANEEATFQKWLAETDEHLAQWCCDIPDTSQSNQDPALDDQNPTMPRSISYFERNLEVWRQLWRVTEISDIILVLVDSRCPTLHYPPSLAQYLAESNKRVVLVLTKVDISGSDRTDAWASFLRNKYPTLRVVQVESYSKNPEDNNTRGTKRTNKPDLPHSFRENLVNTLREIHEEMLEPPEAVKQNEDSLRSWKPPVKRELDWNTVMQAKGDKVGMAVEGTTAPAPQSEDRQHPNEQAEPQFLTIGLIGQPNVGKSSLLNALFGASRVRASKTPGKTKHFQTLFWTPELCLVDCPGLVMPNYIPMETQVLISILPIARVSAVPACIYHVCTLLPLEKIFQLVHPREPETPEVDKRTWRNDVQAQRVQAKARPKADLFWTATDVLTAYALKKGWVTAQAGRPDANRAGNAILRILDENRIRWAFWPPESETVQTDGHGIWVEDAYDDIEEESEESAEENVEETKAPSDSEGESSSIDEESEWEEEEDIATGGSRFHMLEE